MYQESLVQALAQYLQVKLLVFDSADIRLEVRKSSSHYQDRLMDASSIAQYDQRGGFPQVIEEDNLKFKEEGIVNSEASSLSNRIQEATSALDNFLSISGSKKTVADVSNLGPFTRLNAKSRTEGAKDLATVTAAPTTAMAVDSSRRQLKKGDRVKYVGPSMTGGPPGLAVVAHGTSNGGPTSGSRGRVLIVLEDNLNKVGVRFDKPVYGGNNLLDLCEDGHGYFCNAGNKSLIAVTGASFGAHFWGGCRQIDF
ncbi:hypothetical protein O6H91_Y576300 [Diphasiastrum complanatum]|nr:hypothetical protein O6H91_Y576300 [Diphasiastrum complanatum]